MKFHRRMIPGKNKLFNSFNCTECIHKHSERRESETCGKETSDRASTPSNALLVSFYCYFEHLKAFLGVLLQSNPHCLPKVIPFVSIIVYDSKWLTSITPASAYRPFEQQSDDSAFRKIIFSHAQFCAIELSESSWRRSDCVIHG